MYQEDLEFKKLQWLICHMYKENLELDNPQVLISHKTQLNQILYI